jgi:hypothetical protein
LTVPPLPPVLPEGYDDDEDGGGTVFDEGVVEAVCVLVADGGVLVAD